MRPRASGRHDRCERSGFGTLLNGFASSIRVRNGLWAGRTDCAQPGNAKGWTTGPCCGPGRGFGWSVGKGGRTSASGARGASEPGGPATSVSASIARRPVEREPDGCGSAPFGWSGHSTGWSGPATGRIRREKPVQRARCDRGPNHSSVGSTTSGFRLRIRDRSGSGFRRDSPARCGSGRRHRHGSGRACLAPSVRRSGCVHGPTGSGCRDRVPCGKDGRCGLCVGAALRAPAIRETGRPRCATDRIDRDPREIAHSDCVRPGSGRSGRVPCGSGCRDRRRVRGRPRRIGRCVPVRMHRLSGRGRPHGSSRGHPRRERSDPSWCACCDRFVPDRRRGGRSSRRGPFAGSDHPTLPSDRRSGRASRREAQRFGPVRRFRAGTTAGQRCDDPACRNTCSRRSSGTRAGDSPNTCRSPAGSGSTDDGSTASRSRRKC